MKTYIIGLHHDDGDTSISVRANSIEEAKKLVMDIEKCPERSITWFSVKPSNKQVERTKSLLRGI